MKDYIAYMLHHGDCTLIPNQLVPTHPTFWPMVDMACINIAVVDQKGRSFLVKPSLLVQVMCVLN